MKIVYGLTWRGLILTFISFFYFPTNAQVGIGTTTPDANAILDITSPASGPGGLLLPRVALNSANNTAPLTGSITPGMAVYNTATSGSGTNQVTPGFYYHNGSEWVRIAAATDLSDDWKLKGNSGTVAGTDFLGTIDNNALQFKTNAFSRFEITSGTSQTLGGRLRAFTNGSAADPVYSWNANSNTGMFQAGTNILGFSTNGGERMRILANGQVIINKTTAVAGERFTVQGDPNEKAINGYSSGSSGRGVYGNAGPGLGVLGESNGNGIGVKGVNAGAGEGVAGWSSSTGTGVYGNNSGSGYGVFGQSAAGGVGVQGHNPGPGKGVVGLSGNNGVGVLGQSATNGNGVNGFTVGTGNGVYGQNTGDGNAVFGNSAGATGIGVLGLSNKAAGLGVRAINTHNKGIGLMVTGGGAVGATYDGLGASIAAPRFAAVGFGTNASDGTGVIGIGNGDLYIPSLTTGSGVAASGDTGVFAVSTTVSDGTGVIGVGNDNYNINTLTVGSGIAGTGSSFGVAGFGTEFESSGGYFIGDGSYAYVGAWSRGTAYKVIGNGTVSTIVQDIHDKPIVMFAPEAPEVLFQDYGIGKLSNGAAIITMDPNLVKNIRVDENHPLKVFVQLEGDCNGVYVTDKSARSFKVMELQNGSSNVSFSWQIVATRANDKIERNNGENNISDYSIRFPPAPIKLQTSQKKIVSSEATVVTAIQSELKPLVKQDLKERGANGETSQNQSSDEGTSTPNYQFSED